MSLLRSKTKTQRPAVNRRTRVFLGSGVSKKSVTHFTRQLATMIRRGLSLLKSLELLERQQKPGRFKQVIGELTQNVRSGNPLSQGLAAHPKVFSELYLNMVRAGEVSGQLDAVLDRLARFMEKSHKVQSKIIAAMLYPIVVLVLAATILGFLMVFVVPKFQIIYEDFLGGASLPTLTRIVMNISLWVQGNSLTVLMLILLAFLGLKTLGNVERVQYVFDAFKLQVPIFGELIRKNCLSRFSRTLGTLLGSAVPLLEALEITKAVVGNRVFQKELTTIYARVMDGDPISRPLLQAKQFPDILCSLVEVGEETGTVPEMLNQVADDYEDELDTTISGLTSILEPFMIVFLAVVVGFIVIALFLPLVGIFEQLGT